MSVLPVPLPYGLRDIKITPYTDSNATTLAAESIDLPYARTMSFSESEEFQELRGDDKVVTTRGRGAAVEWEMESGGLPLDAAVAMFGGKVIESGTEPDRKRIYRKAANDARPFFKAEGQAVSDSGGDIHVILYRCRSTGEFSGELSDGEFWLTSGSGVALPSVIPVPGADTEQDEDVIYDFVQNESFTSIE